MALHNSNKHISLPRVNNGRDLPHENSSLTLIISAQAAHWFDLPYFYQEV